MQRMPAGGWHTSAMLSEVPPMQKSSIASAVMRRFNPPDERQNAIGVIGAGAAGAALMYFMDSQRGNRRRKRMRDRIVHAGHASSDFLGTARRDGRNRLRGIAAEASAAFRDATTDDWVLEERVRAELGRAVSHPGAIDVISTNGTVTLTGHVLKSEHADLLSQVEKVAGVDSVEDLLEIHASPGDVSSLQGEGRRRERRFELAQTNWAPAPRLVVGAAGAALATYGARERGFIGGMCSMAGLALLARSVSNLELSRVVGTGGGRRAIGVRKTISIDAPVSEVFAFFTDWERWPEWMSHVKSVTATGPRGAVGERTHWEVDGPAGTTVSWDAETTRFAANELVSWRSVEGAAIRQAGTLRFGSNPDGTTRVHIQMTYNPPGGAAGHAVATLLGADPRHQMHEDLARLKTTIESGTPPHDAAVH